MKQITFKDPQKEKKLPFVIYVQFEHIRMPVTRQGIEHKPCAFTYLIKSTYDDSLTKSETYLGEQCSQVFWERLDNSVKEISDRFKSTTVNEQSLNHDQRNAYVAAQSCCVCGGVFSSSKKKCEGYCEFTGSFLGAIHENCKSKKKSKLLPVIVDDFKSAGSHFILQGLKQTERDKLYYLPQKETSYICFTKYIKGLQVRFIGSDNFMDFDDTEINENDDENLGEIKSGKFYPYSYMDSFAKFEETSLPNSDGFYDLVHEEDISEDGYENALKIWDERNCKKIKDYYLALLEINRVSFVEGCEKFRDLCYTTYKLDPFHYYTIAGLAWDSMLRLIKDKVKLEVLEDKEMTRFFLDNIRGGILQCVKRYSKANNKFCGDFNVKEPSTFIVYLDANNLSGWAMSQPLPYGGFSWLTPEEVQDFTANITEIPLDGDCGYAAEVDLEYSRELHTAHNDLPFCCDSKEKVRMSLHDKKNYVLLLGNLQLCLKFGLKLTKVHKVLKFKQSCWMKDYIEFNTNLRSQSETDFEKKFYKMMNNSVHGKAYQKTGNTKEKPFYAGFCILELSKYFMYNFHYEHMLGKYRSKNLRLLYTDTDAFIYEITTKNFFWDLRSKNFSDLFDTSDLDPKYKVKSRNKKVPGKMKDECEGKIVKEFYGVGAKFYCLVVDGEDIKKAAGVPKYVKRKFMTKNDYKSCVFDEEKVRKDMYLTTSDKVHKVFTKQTLRTVLSPGDNKRIILSDKINTRAVGYYEPPT